MYARSFCWTVEVWSKRAASITQHPQKETS